MVWMLLVACAGTVLAPPRVVVATGPVATAVASATPVDFSSLEQRVNALLAETQDTDSRERLAELRDLLADMRAREPLAQRRVFLYATRVLTIEERARPVAIDLAPLAPLQETVLEVPLTPPDRPPPPTMTRPPATPSVPAAPAPDSPTAAVPAAPGPPTPGPVVPSAEAAPSGPPSSVALAVSPPAVVIPAAGEPTEADRVAAARRALATAQYLEAIALLGPSEGAGAKAVRREAVDGWAREQRASAGRDFVLARAMPLGESRTRALEAVAKQLADINARFPDNAYAADVARSLDYVDRTLSGALP